MLHYKYNESLKRLIIKNFKKVGKQIHTHIHIHESIHSE